MAPALKICVIFVIFLIQDGQTDTATEQMRSWYDFLSSLGTSKLVLNPDSSNTNPFERAQNGRDQGELSTGELEGEDDDAMTPDSYCKQETAGRLKYYCRGLHDGDYFDPWNPYCGFIRCSSQVPERMICQRGSWMGSEYGASKGQFYMCRRALSDLKMDIKDEDNCPMKTDLLNLCETAHKVSGMNDLV